MVEIQTQADNELTQVRVRVKALQQQNLDLRTWNVKGSQEVKALESSVKKLEKE